MLQFCVIMLSLTVLFLGITTIFALSYGSIPLAWLACCLAIISVFLSIACVSIFLFLPSERRTKSSKVSTGKS